ncbi:azurin [Azomonas macrocytogenes]
MLSSFAAWSADKCAVEITSTDQMTFDSKLISIPKSCSSFTVTLLHSGEMPKEVMGHNWVLTRAADMQAVAQDGWSAGIANGYLKKNDTRVIAHTKLIGGGERDSITIDTSKLETGEKYHFFCSVPAHLSVMKGELTFGV